MNARLRIWCALAAAAVVVGGYGVFLWDFFATRAVVSCLVEKYGSEGAPMSDLGECHARWDATLGHLATRAIFADAAGPYGAMQRASGLCWTMGPALILLLLAAAANPHRAPVHWGIVVLPIIVCALFFVGYAVGLSAAEDQTMAGWSSARLTWDIFSFVCPPATALAAVTSARSA